MNLASNKVKFVIIMEKERDKKNYAWPYKQRQILEPLF